MKTHHLFGLALLGTLCSSPVLAQTATSGTTAAPGVPIDPSNTTATPAVGNSAAGQPGTTPPVVTPPGTVYPPATTAPSKKMQTQKRSTKTSRTTKRP